jgi:hypothetical protein
MHAPWRTFWEFVMYSKQPSDTANIDGIEMQQALARLRASRAQADKEDIESSAECGKAWAMREATWSELRDVVNLNGEARPLDGLCGRLNGHLGHDLDYFKSFYPQSRKTPLPMSDEEAEAFIKGAKLVMDAV